MTEKKQGAYKATAIIALSLIISFLVLSHAKPFIPVETIKSLAFNIHVKPQGLPVFWLVHAGYAHLLANLLGVILFGLLVEKWIGSRHTLGLFLVAGIGAPLLFTIFFPSIQLVGASAGLSGLIVSALILEPKKAVGELIIVLLAISGLVVFANELVKTQQASLQTQKQELQIGLNQAIQQQDMEKQKNLKKSLEELQTKKQQIQESQEFQQQIPVENRVHGIGAVLGALYLLWATPNLTRRRVHKLAQQLLGFAKRSH